MQQLVLSGLIRLEHWLLGHVHRLINVLLSLCRRHHRQTNLVMVVALDGGGVSRACKAVGSCRFLRPRATCGLVLADNGLTEWFLLIFKLTRIGWIS